MLREFFVHYVIIGHSERRAIYGETDAMINAKIRKAREANLKPIFCIGETLAEREGGMLETVLRTQVTDGLKDVSEKDLSDIVIAYEPVWAIGTGVTATRNRRRKLTPSSAPSSPISMVLIPPRRSVSNTAVP